MQLQQYSDTTEEQTLAQLLAALYIRRPTIGNA
jgi:hypothetical protein